MPAQSQQQQKLFGLALSVKRGETPRSEASKEVLDIVDSMTEKQIEDFAGTSHSGLPKKVESALRELIKNAIKDNVVGDIVKEHKDCGCGCKGTTVGGCNTSLTEGLFQDIMKGVKNGSGPFTMVVIKDNKVVKQVNVNTPQSIPANYTSLEKQYPNARIRVEDSTGKIVFGEGVVNESSVEIGDIVFLKSAKKIATVIDRFGRSVTVKTGDGKKVKTVINNIKTLAQDNVNEKLDNKQLALLKYAYKDIKKINPSEPAYGRMVKHLDTLSKSELQQLADAGINFISLLAKNRLMRSESVNEEKPGLWANIRAKKARGEKPAHGNSQAHKDAVKAGKKIKKSESVDEAVPTQTKWAVAIASLTATRPDAVQKFIDDNNLNSEKLYQFLKKSNASSRFGGFAMDFVTAISGKPGNPIQKKMIKMFGESVNEGARIVLVDPNTNKFTKTHIFSGPNRDADKEVEKLNSKLSSPQKNKGLYWKIASYESVNEVASRTAMEIGGLTGMNKDAVQKFVDEHNLDIEKLYQYVKKGKLKERMDFVSAVVGNPGNKIQKMIIAKFGMK
jgi:hypothetical protein